MTINTITGNQNNPNTGLLMKWKNDIAGWKNMLYLRMEENILLKNMLANILRNNYNRNCLEEIEEFQNQFINQDRINEVLKREIVDLDDLLFKRFEAERIGDLFEKKAKKLRDDISLSERRFQLLVSSFREFQKKICG